jgi:hypothetical protein
MSATLTDAHEPLPTDLERGPRDPDLANRIGRMQSR